jgi:hypothetical protein
VQCGRSQASVIALEIAMYYIIVSRDSLCYLTLCRVGTEAYCIVEYLLEANESSPSLKELSRQSKPILDQALFFFIVPVREPPLHAFLQLVM